MKLYVKDDTGKKIYINVVASTRGELARILNSKHFWINNKMYDVNEVWAETDSGHTLTGAIVGGVLGLIGGPVGTIAGAILGGFLGNEKDNDEKQKVLLFNNSHAS